MTPKSWLALSPEEILGAFEFKLCKYNKKIDREILKDALKGLKKSEIYRVYVECLYEPFMTMGVVLKVASRINAEINAPFLEQAKNLARALELKVLRCCEDRIDGCKPIGFYENEMRFLEKVFGSWESVVDNLYYHSADRELFIGQLENAIFLALKKQARATKTQDTTNKQVGISVSTNQDDCAKTNVAEVVETKAEIEVAQENAQTLRHVARGSEIEVSVVRLIPQIVDAVGLAVQTNRFDISPPKIDTG